MEEVSRGGFIVYCVCRGWIQCSVRVSGLDSVFSACVGVGFSVCSLCRALGRLTCCLYPWPGCLYLSLAGPQLWAVIQSVAAEEKNFRSEMSEV